MYNYNILFKITGSIAAYKSAYLISKLVQQGFKVKTVATEYALNFIGKATLEGLTGNPVYTDSFADSEMMSHINLVKWADITIVCPASANTINKMSAGIADNLLTSLFLAHDWAKPYLIAPAMNTNMYDHPSTQNSIKKLTEWGVKVLPTNEGYLACGDIGKGKLLEPDEIYNHIINALDEKKVSPGKKLNMLITSGGTKEEIDGVRYLTNLSTGKTGTAIAEYFIKQKHDVTFIHSVDSVVPSADCKKTSFISFQDLDNVLQNVLSNQDFDAVIHLAAVGDYSVEFMETENSKLPLPLENKIDSSNAGIILHLKPNKKIVNSLKNYSKNKKIRIIAFKLTNTKNESEKENAVKKLLSESNCDYVIQNDKNDRDNGTQKNFTVYNAIKNIENSNTAFGLASILEKILTTEKK